MNLQGRGLRKALVYMGGEFQNNLKEMPTNTRNYGDSAQNRNYWRALVNMALNLRVP
jgi:hypothetical protein